MTDATTAAEAVFVARGRPVARFVAAIVLVGALLTVVWFTGAANPRLELAIESWEGADRGRAVVVVHNRGLTDAQVHIVDVSHQFVRLARPVPPMEVGGGGTRRVTVHYAVDCAGHARLARTPAGATDPILPLVVRTKGPVGPWQRWVRDHDASVDPLCAPS